MKKIILLCLGLIICEFSFSKKKPCVKDSNNGITCYRTSNIEIKLVDKFEIHLELYTDGNEKKYYVVGENENNTPHCFPPSAKILFKLFDGNLVELSMIETTCYASSTSTSTKAYYPINLDEIEAIEKGVAKMRVEMLSLDKKQTPFADYQDVEFKKDKIGEYFKLMHDAIETEINKEIEGRNALEAGDANDGF